MEKNQIYSIFGTDYKAMTKQILAASGLCGRIPDKAARIGIKPNLVVAAPAVTGATTHPEIVAGIIEYLRENGFRNLCVTEGCWIGENTETCLEYTGFSRLCQEYEVPFLDVKKAGSHPVDCAGMELQVSDVMNDIDFLINVPVLKGHCQVKMTCALKNCKGLVPDSEKRRFHALGIHRPVGHLGAGIRSDFIVVDNICGDPDFEEGGNPVTRNCILTALDPVLLDTYAALLFHLPLADVPYIGIAEECGIGSADLQQAEIITLNENPEQAALSPTSRVLDVAYAVEELDACSACYANLIPALLQLQEEGLLEQLPCRVAIGQNHRGRTGQLGIGSCTRCFDTCIRGCPPEKEDIYAGLKAFILQHYEPPAQADIASKA